ncbi:MBL fold metallo-hydrolase [Clostridia bacterium]|nr:MBL fold metallo-hydrolase [Clostridia bacterium]
MKLSTFRTGTFSANTYLICDEITHEAALIDPGVYSQSAHDAIIQRELNLKYILLTHGHFDHILGAERHKADAPNACIAVHSLDEELLLDPAKSHAKAHGSDSVVHADILLQDGDIISLGSVNLRVMHTPGHTAGSCVFIDESNRNMFSGDTIFDGDYGRYDLYGGDYNSLMNSLIRIKSLEGNYKIHPGHGGTTTLEKERNTQFP